MDGYEFRYIANEYEKIYWGTGLVADKITFLTVESATLATHLKNMLLAAILS